MEVIGPLNASRFSFSPVKTPPHGRAGLSSPEKRLVKDLDKSARKRANNSLYNRLMDEYLDTDDYLDEQDRITTQRKKNVVIKLTTHSQAYCAPNQAR